MGFGSAPNPPESGCWGSASSLDHLAVVVAGGGACPGVSQPSKEFSLEAEPTARPSGGRIVAPKSGPDVALVRPAFPPDHCRGWRYGWAGACPTGCAADHPSPSTLSPLTHGGPKVGLFCKLVLGTRRPTGKSTGAVPALCVSSVSGDPRCWGQPEPGTGGPAGPDHGSAAAAGSAPSWSSGLKGESSCSPAAVSSGDSSWICSGGANEMSRLR